jgi:hypothetical protein
MVDVASSVASRPGAGRIWILAGLLALGLYDGAFVVKWWQGAQLPPLGDFFAFWSFGRFAAVAGAKIYDTAALVDYQHTLVPALGGGYPYPYPPSFLLLLVPLGWMVLPAAYLCWIGGTFALYVAATLGRRWRSLAGLALLTAPTTLMSVISGQNGLLSAALLVGALRSLPHLPILAGVLFGLLGYKPQLALIVPVVLFASRSTDALLAAAVTVVVLIAASSAAFGASIWLDWIQGFPAYRQLLENNQATLLHLMATLPAGMDAVGAPMRAGYALQLVCAGIAVVLTWRACASGIDARATAMAILATIITAPYVMIYDMPMIAAALAIYWRAHPPARLWEVALVIALFTSLLAMMESVVPFAASVLIVALFLVIAFAPARRASDIAPSTIGA